VLLGILGSAIKGIVSWRPLHLPIPILGGGAMSRYDFARNIFFELSDAIL